MKNLFGRIWESICVLGRATWDCMRAVGQGLWQVAKAPVVYAASTYDSGVSVGWPITGAVLAVPMAVIGTALTVVGVAVLVPLSVVVTIGLGVYNAVRALFEPTPTEYAEQRASDAERMAHLESFATMLSESIGARQRHYDAKAEAPSNGGAGDTIKDALFVLGVLDEVAARGGDDAQDAAETATYIRQQVIKNFPLHIVDSEDDASLDPFLREKADNIGRAMNEYRQKTAGKSREDVMPFMLDANGDLLEI